MEFGKLTYASIIILSSGRKGLLFPAKQANSPLFALDRHHLDPTHREPGVTSTIQPIPFHALLEMLYQSAMAHARSLDPRNSFLDTVDRLSTHVRRSSKRSSIRTLSAVTRTS